MPEKWTEIDGEKDGEGEERGIAGIPARTGHTQETGNKKSPFLLHIPFFCCTFAPDFKIWNDGQATVKRR